MKVVYLFNQNNVKVNNLKANFTIKDLENLSGIKAHTIRIWEKRYQLLKPQRSNGNIRYYDTYSLLKLLNVSLLNKNKYKISKIAELSDDAIVLLAREISSKSAVVDDGVNSFKMAMFSFDQALFNQTYNQFLINKTFRQLFVDVFIPLLNQIGLMWQTNALTIAHEHFISSLITQKIQVNTEKVQQNVLADDSEVYVLFLPENEIHELGLMYLNYELSLRSKKTIYLGQSMPLENLKILMSSYKKVIFVTSFTVSPVPAKLNSYLEAMDALLSETAHSFSVFGFRVENLDAKQYKSTFSFFPSLEQIISSL